MAINYLNSVDLNKNYLNNAAIQNLAVEPTADTPGQVYFNTTSQVLKVTVQTGTSPDTFAWEEVGGGIEGSGTLNTIPKFTPGTETIGDSSITDNGTTVNFSGSLISLDDANNADAIISAPGKMFIELDNDNSGTDERFEIRTTVAGSKAARLSIDDDGNTAVLGGFVAGAYAIIVGDIDVQGGTIELGGTDTRVIKGKDVPEIAGNTPGLDIITGFLTGTDTLGTNLTLSAAQGTGTGNGGNIVFKVATPSGTSGTASNALATAMTISGINGDVVFTNGIQVDSDSIFYGDITADSGIAMSNNKITGLLNPTAAQDAATKSYVDTAVTGLLQFQGGFDADTGTIDGGTTNLTKNDQPTAGDETVAVAVGDYYVVTADGDFFGNTATPLTVGDSVIVKTAAAAGASVEGNFIVVQSDTDLATATTVGLGNVVPGASATITAPYTSGTATIDVVDSTAVQKGAVIVAGSDPIEVTYASGTASVGIKDSATDQKGAVSLEGGTGITVTYTSGHAIISRTSAIYNAVRRSLDTTVAGNPGSVTRTVSGGTTTFTVNTNSMSLGAASALDVKAEVMSAAGQTVYADITRSGNVLSVIFTGTVNDGDYEVLMSATVNKG